jgi:hypothetical protein
MKFVTTKFKSGGLHEKHVVATWNVGNHLSKNKIYINAVLPTVFDSPKCVLSLGFSDYRTIMLCTVLRQNKLRLRKMVNSYSDFTQSLS